MILIPFIAVGVATLLVGIIDAIFRDMKNWQSLLFRALTMAFLAVFALIAVNLTSTCNALSLFISIGIVLYLVKMLDITHKIENEKTKLIYSGVLDILIIVIFALSTLSLAPFNVLATAGGLLLGIALGLLVWAIRRDDRLDRALVRFFKYFALGLFLGLAISGLFTSNHLASAIIIICASIAMLTKEILSEFMKTSRSKQIALDILAVVILIAMVVSIYVY